MKNTRNAARERLRAMGLCIALALVPTTHALAKPYGIEFDVEVYDFGEAEEGSTVQHTYVFRNTGTTTIEIRSVRPSCGCTTAGEWDKTVAPGKTGRIPITFIAQRFNGSITKVIDVTTNVPDRRNIRLEFKGKITIPIDVVPFNAWLGEIGRDTKVLAGKFEITNNTGRPIDIIDIVPPDERTTFEFRVIEKHVKYSLAYTVRPPFDGSETVGKKFKLRTNDKKREYVYPQFFYHVPLPLKVSPVKLEVDTTRLPRTPIVLRINVKSSMNVPIAVYDLTLHDGRGIRYTLDEKIRDAHYQITVTIPKDFRFEKKDRIRMTFRVKNDPSKSLYDVPITPMIASN